MVKRDNELIREIRENVRGGIGKVEFCHISKDEQLNPKCKLFARLTIEPGASIGYHQHFDETEIYYVISGQAAADDNGTPVTLNPGDVMYTGGGKGHSVTNNSNEPFVFIAEILFD